MGIRTTSDNDSAEGLIDYWRQLTKEIARIEAGYPFMATTLVTLIVGVLASRNTAWFESLAAVAPYLVPVLMLLGLTYVLSRFRTVALLRGYSAFVEDEINTLKSNRVYLWNSQYINRFEQNNGPNLLMVVLNVMLLSTTIWALVMILSSNELWPWLLSPWNIAFYSLNLLVLMFVAGGFARNDVVRRRAYRFALFENHPELKPEVCVYPGERSWFDRSGIGRARANHKVAAESAGLRITADRFDPYQVLHVSTWGVPAFFRIRAARRQGAAVVVSAHSSREDFVGSIPASRLLAPLFGRWLRALYSAADIVVAPSEYAKERITELGVRAPIRVVSGGVDTAVFAPNEPDRVSAFARTTAGILGVSDKVVIGVGFTFERKGFLDFLNVARNLPELKFVWCGPVLRVFAGPRVSWALLRKPKNVILTGFVSPPSRLAAMLNASDAFLGLAHEETEGLAVLEALASGTPSVIRDLPAYPSIDTNVSGVRVVGISSGTDEVIESLRSILASSSESVRTATSRLAVPRSLTAISDDLGQIFRQLINDPRD